MDSDHAKGFYDIDLNDNLEGQVDFYEQGRQSYWEGLGVWSAIEYDKAERFAKAVLKNSEQLIPNEEIDGDLSKLQNETNRINRAQEIYKRAVDILLLDLPEDKKRNLLGDLFKEMPPDPQSEESPLKLVWERFIIDMSWEAIRKIEEGASRIFRLYTLVLGYTPSKSTQQFLGRLSRCFIWGFDPECVILCRAVLDTAFRDTVSDEVCEKRLDKRRRYNFTLNDRILAALNDGVIDEKTKKLAMKVKECGVKAVHYQPDITKDVFGTIRDTLTILEKLNATKEKSG